MQAAKLPLNNLSTSEFSINAMELETRIPLRKHIFLNFELFGFQCFGSRNHNIWRQQSHRRGQICCFIDRRRVSLKFASSKNLLLSYSTSDTRMQSVTPRRLILPIHCEVQSEQQLLALVSMEQTAITMKPTLLWVFRSHTWDR